MENASKALVIVGGILITVLVISISMYLFTGAREFSQASDERLRMSEKEAFNRFFEYYDENITGLDVYNIIGKADDINASEFYSNTIKYSGAQKKQVEDTNKFNEKYKYSYFDNDSDGFIDTIIFSK